MTVRTCSSVHHIPSLLNDRESVFISTPHSFPTQWLCERVHLYTTHFPYPVTVRTCSLHHTFPTQWLCERVNLSTTHFPSSVNVWTCSSLHHTFPTQWLYESVHLCITLSLLSDCVSVFISTPYTFPYSVTVWTCLSLNCSFPTQWLFERVHFYTTLSLLFLLSNCVNVFISVVHPFNLFISPLFTLFLLKDCVNSFISALHPLQGFFLLPQTVAFVVYKCWKITAGAAWTRDSWLRLCGTD